MNTIQTLNRVNFYNDVTRNARWTFQEVTQAVNDAIYDFIDRNLGSMEDRSPDSFQSTQLIRENLRNLIKTATITPTNGTVVTNRYYSVTPSHITLPSDYYSFVTLNVLIDGFTDYSRPTTYNESGPLFKDSFKHPTNNKTYFNEDATGLKIYRGVGGTFTSATLEYIRETVNFNLSDENYLIDAGGAVLVIGLSYIATQTSVSAGTLYNIGDQFTAVSATLTSGQVILSTLLSPIDLPVKEHDNIAKMASVILMKVSGNYNQAQATESEVAKS